MTPKDEHPMRTISLEVLQSFKKGMPIKVVLKDNDHVRPDSRGKEFVGEFQSLTPEKPGDDSVWMVHMFGEAQHMESPDEAILSPNVLYSFHDWLIESIVEAVTNLHSVIAQAIGNTRRARVAAGVSRESQGADEAYAQAAYRAIFTHIKGVEVTVDGKKMIFAPEDIKLIY